MGMQQALGQRLLISGFGTCQQFLDLRLQLRLDLLRMPVGERAVERGICVNLGAIQRNRAQLEQLHLPGDAQHLHEQRLDFLEEALAEGAKGVVVRLLVRSDIAEGNRFVGRRLDVRRLENTPVA